MYEVEVTERAQRAAHEDIEDHLSMFSHGSDIDKVVATIEETIDTLGDKPTRHRLLHPPIPDRVIRCAPAGKYVVYFTVNEGEKRVTVLDVQHHRRSDTLLRRRLA